MTNPLVPNSEYGEGTAVPAKAAVQTLPRSAPAASAGAEDAPAPADAGAQGSHALVAANTMADGNIVAELATRLAQDGATSAAAGELAARAAEGHSVAAYAAHYLLAKVSGQSPGTVEVKTRDLAAFTAWFMQHHRRPPDPGNIGRWCEADTHHYLRQLEGQGRKPATINRILSSLRGFARWVHERPGGVFVHHGMPVADVRPRHIEEPECKKLTEAQIAAMFAMAQAAVDEEDAKARGRADKRRAAWAGRGPQGGAVAQDDNGDETETRGRARPRRNRAILAVLLCTGMRVSELVALTREQYDGEAVYDVMRKGRRRSRKVMLLPGCTRLVDDYIERERALDVAFLNDQAGGAGVPDASRPLFLAARSGAAVDRVRIGRILQLLAARAGAGPAAGGQGGAFKVHPHRLRHTFAAVYRTASGSDTETAAALGHSSTKYVGRYACDSDLEREDTLKRAMGNML